MAAVQQLGYLGFEVSNLGAWESFGRDVLGLEVAPRADGGLGLRLDSYRNRIFLDPGASDDLSFLGWQVADQAALDELSGKLRSAGVDVTAGTEEECVARGVQRLVKYRDPGGIPSELFFGPAKAAEPFRSKVVPRGFVADDLGLGHLVISAKSQQESKDFYTNVLGFRLSDYIVTTVYNFPVNIAFFHAQGTHDHQARHHSIAFGEQQKKRLHHFMLEAKTMDDVGLCFDRTWRSGLKIMQTLGRHPNDRMFSFYAKTPSGFQFEYGWGGRSIDDADWQTTTYDHISEWGHHPPQFVAQPPPAAGGKS
jgi:2,3-dihydroxybiphenyl 1,2-dioxygenase